jgi:hypothetical protein
MTYVYSISLQLFLVIRRDAGSEASGFDILFLFESQLNAI